MEPHQRISVRNATSAATAWVASPVGRLARIEVLVSLSCTLLAVLVFLGSGRRSSSSSAFRVAVWSSLMLSYPAVSYTIGLMQSASFRNELIVAWGCFLLLILGCADGISAYSLNDSDQQARTVLNQGLQLVYVFILLVSYVGSLSLKLKVLLSLLWALSTVKLGMRIRSSVRAGRSRILTSDSKLIADYMSREHELGGADYDASSMKGYKYVVAGEEIKDGNGNGEDRETIVDTTTTNNTYLVTVDRVWECQGRLLNSGDPAAARRRDLCLSFAMFKLLRRRFGRFPLHETCLNKTRDFVKLGLLGGSASGDYERLYRVVEVELGFLFDLFYTRYPSLKESLIPETIIFTTVVTASLCTLFSLSPALLDYRAPRADPNIAATRFDIWLTRAIIILYLVLESFQFFMLGFSDWHKVKLLCRYVREPAWQSHSTIGTLLGFMCRVRVTNYWNNSVGQYSILHSCSGSDRSSILRMPLPKWIRGFLIRSRMTHHRKLPDTVKQAIHQFLKSALVSIRNGEYTLTQALLIDDFHWAIAHENIIRSILIWHIATTICESRCKIVHKDDNSLLVATTLSAYCAYLVLAAPELLPGHGYETQLLLEAVQLRAQRCLRGCKSEDEMYSMLASLQSSDSHEDVLAQGTRLGDDIMHNISEVRRWKVLAELWVEMLLSVAPSSNITGHVQKLATGGELITHLWTLLTHAGIIENPVNRYQSIGS